MKTKIWKCRIFGMTAILLFYILPSFAQQYSGYASNLMQSKATSMCFPLDTTSSKRIPVYYYLNSNINSGSSVYVGKNDPGTCDNMEQWRTYRMCYKWNISSIPSNATINSATIDIWYTASSQTSSDVAFSIMPFSLQKWVSDAAAVWTACSTGTAYSTHFVPTTTSTQSISVNYAGSHSLCRDIASNLPSQAVAVALITIDDQIWNLTNRNRYLQPAQTGNPIQGVKLTINYTFPITVTVRNGMSGNGDTVRVNGVPRISPYSFNSTSSVPCTLSTNPITVNGTRYTPTGWKNVNTGQIVSGNPQVVIPIQNTTYESVYSITSVPVSIRQQFNSGNLTSVGVGLWQGRFSFVTKPNPWDTILSVGASYCLRGYQDTLSGEKYNNWSVNDAQQTDIKNHHSFTIEPNTSTLKSHLQPTTQGSNIKIDLLDAPGNYSGTVQFKDPWLIDYSDPSFSNNKRNQGMNAPFKNRTAAFSPNIGTNYSGDVYKGVFLIQPVIDGKPYYTVGAPQTQSFSVNGQTYTGYFQNWSGTNVAFQNANSQQTGVVFQSANATAIAQYKGIHLSNNTMAFSKNSQRKLVQSYSAYEECNWLHQVYASAGYVWIEHSSDNGLTWILGNDGKALGSGKNPSISYFPRIDWGNNYIVVVWQQPSGSTYTIQGIIFNQMSSQSGLPYSQGGGSTTLFTEPYDSYSIDANPNIVTAIISSMYAVTFERKNNYNGLQAGINWLAGFLENYSNADYRIPPPVNNGAVAGTDAGSTNGALSLNPHYTNGALTLDADLVYQTGSGLRYTYLDFYNYYGVPNSSQQYPPSAIGYSGPVNINPSVVSFPINGNFSTSWIEYDVLAYCYSGNPSVIYYYGSGVQSCAINRGGDNSGFAAWSQNNGGTWTNKSIRFQNYIPSSSTIQTLSTTGKYVQLANSTTSDLNYMYVSSFYPSTVPYHFATSAVLGPLNKNASNFAAGRGFAINKGDSSFSYSFEDLNVDGKNIGFADAPDTLDYSKIEILNNTLVTEPFELTSKSKVIFTEKSGFADSASAVQKLGGNCYMRYKVELLDNATGKVIGTVKNVNLTSANAHSFKISSYSLNTKDIGNKTVKAKITLETNLIDAASTPVKTMSKTGRPNFLQPGLILTKRYTEENETLAKASIKELRIEGSEIPISYAINQNYPNPFNPSTVIKYQIPVAAHITLKVYDVLGREVSDLVNDIKEAGYHSVAFDGSRLSSGIYFARFIAQPLGEMNQPFVQVKKMILTK